MATVSIKIVLAILASMIAGGSAFAENIEVGPGDYKQHYEGGGERNISVPEGQTGNLDVRKGDTITKQDPNTGETIYYDVE